MIMGQFSFFRPLLTFPAHEGIIKVSLSNLVFFAYRLREKATSALPWRAALWLMAFLLLSTTSFAQTLPSADRCTSKDLELVRARLDLPKCFACTPGQTITRTLLLSIDNKTGSTRTSFAFWGTLVIRNADGTIASSTSASGCNGPIPSNSVTELPFLVNGGQITFTCGQTLQLTNLFLAWTDASPKSTCPLNSALIAPKCGTLPSIEISTGLAVSGVVTNAGCSGANNGAINLTVSGGLRPYTIDWADLSGTNNPEDRTGLGPGTYSVTVTDANRCTATASFTITQPPAVTRPTVTIVEPSICGSPTGTVTVTSPLGTNYEYSNGGTTYQSSPTFSVAAGAGFNIFVRDKTSGCTSPGTNCNNFNSTSAAAQSPAGVSAVQAASAVPAATAAKAPAATKLAAKAEADMMAYPIPFTQRTTLEFNALQDENYVINLYDLNGTLIKQLKAGKAIAGEVIRVEVDGTRLAESMYLVRKESKTGVNTVKLLKKR
jgi:hypothetical protein